MEHDKKDTKVSPKEYEKKGNKASPKENEKKDNKASPKENEKKDNKASLKGYEKKANKASPKEYEKIANKVSPKELKTVDSSQKKQQKSAKNQKQSRKSIAILPAKKPKADKPEDEAFDPLSCSETTKIIEAALNTETNATSAVLDHMGDKEAPDPQEAEEDARSQPKFKVFETVYARDTDGVMYEAVIRRRLYGQNQRKQVQMGLITSEREALELLAQEEEPTWHYFVHFNKWNVNWDRWVKEENVFPVTEKVKEIASAILTEHKTLKQELQKKRKGKKAHQTVDGAEFLRLWRLRKSKLEEELDELQEQPATERLHPENAGFESQSKLDRKRKALPKKQDGWTKAAVAMEVQLRAKGLTREIKDANKVNIAFALKKILVEHWEIIGQCEMVLALPAAVTVRDALAAYLATKDVIWEANADRKPAPKKDQEESAVNINATKSASIGAANDTDEATAPHLSEDEHMESPSTRSHKLAKSPSIAGGSPGSVDGMSKSKMSLHKEWIAMAEGIALLFDQSIPDRLLYRQELPQFHVIDSHPDYAHRRYCEIYGCGHLLRLFVRLPELITDALKDAEARPIFAKVNDFLRFLSKNQGSLFAQPYRKLNDLEKKEQMKHLKSQDRKRKVALANSEAAVAKKPRVLEKSDSENMSDDAD